MSKMQETDYERVKEIAARFQEMSDAFMDGANLMPWVKSSSPGSRNIETVLDAAASVPDGSGITFMRFARPYLSSSDFTEILLMFIERGEDFSALSPAETADWLDFAGFFD